jgi:lysophospholipase L1-like esterase
MLASHHEVALMSCALLISLVIAVTPAEPLVRDGDRVVFLGDSITVLHTWTRLVEVAIRLRHPSWSVTFVNAGVGGNTVRDALERLDVDVLAHRPTVVFVNFGMNDASYPDGSADGAFERNMITLLDRLKAAKVRQVVWLDTTPYDTSTGRGTAFNRHRVTRISELLEFTHKTGEERSIPIVPVNDSVTRAIAAWRAAKRVENLMPDHIHPGPVLFGVMAAEVLDTIGVDVSATKLKVPIVEGVARVPGVDGGVPWPGDRPLELDLSSVKAPLPFVSANDAKSLDSTTLVAQASLVVAVGGLPPKQRFLVRAGTLDVGRFSGAQLAAGVEVMATAPARIAPGPDRADLSICEAATGNPWANDVSCLFNLLFGRDQLRVSMRHEKTRGLPTSVPGYLERLSALQQEWVDAVERDLEARVKAMVARPHVVTIEPEPPK